MPRRVGTVVRLPRNDESGAVLAFAVLLSIAVLAVGHALLFASEGAYVTARAHAHIVEGDAAAEGALEEARRAGWTLWMDLIPVGGRRGDPPQLQDNTTTEVTWRRLSAEGWLVEAAATRTPRPPTVRRRLLWIYDPELRISELPAVVSLGPGAPTEILGSISGDTVALGVVDAPALGLLDLATMLSFAASLGPRGRPEPADVWGACDTAVMWNWGDPSSPSRPCSSYSPLKGRRGALEVDGGEGQVVLVVDGDVLLRAGTRVTGLLIASGRVDVLEGSSFQGRIVAFAGLGVEAGSSVVGSRDRAAAALRAVRDVLGGALPLHPALRLGPE